jgi:hypothetical protein
MHMADGNTAQSLWPRPARRAPAPSASYGRRPRGLAIAAIAVFGLVAAACGGESTPGAGSETVPPTVTTISTTTVPTVTTTTIDFDRPITQDTVPIPAEASIVDLIALVNDMRGQTNNVSDQMARLARFQELASPVSAQILDFSTTVSPIEEDEEFAVESTVRFRVSQDHLTIEMFLIDELRSRGWNKASEGTQQVDGDTATVLVFRVPGIPADETELAVTVTELPGLTLIDYAYRTRTPIADTSFERLQVWQEELATPRSADPISTRIATQDDLGSMSVSYWMTAETTAEAREAVVALQDEEAFTVGTSEGSGASTAPLLLVDANNKELLIDFAITGEADTVEMTVTHTFGLEPVD